MIERDTQERIDRQKEIEQESLMLGAARYRGQGMDWSDKAHPRAEADLPPGKALINRNLDDIGEAIGAFIEAAKSGKAGRRHVALPYLAHADPLQAGYLALRTMVNVANTNSTLTAVAVRIGIALQEHLEMVHMAKEHPGLYRKLTMQLAKSTSSAHRLGVIRHVRRKYKLESLAWGQKEKILVGTKLVELVMEAMPGVFKIERYSRRKHDTPLILTMTDETVEWMEAMHGQCELLAPLYLPMIVTPRKWRTPYAGGYLTGLLKPRLVRTRNRHYLDELGGVDLTRVMSAVNAIQETPWRINKAVLEALHTEMELGGGSAGLPRREALPLPPRPLGIPEDLPMSAMTASQKEALIAWKGEATKVHEANAAQRSDRVILAQKLYVADRFADEDAIYFPHFLDFRGRVYPMPSYLNPQADDVGRGLLEFAEGKPLGEDGAFWLASHIAGLWGIDKVSFDDRVAWVEKNEEAILSSALDPHADDAFWRTAEKPFQALAACFDWMGYKLNGKDHVSHIPMAMDGSCSGLQHYSALLRDEVGGAAVNLVPGPIPADIYTMVAQRAQALSDGSLADTFMSTAWKDKVGRKIAKQPTMTLCYSATKFGMKSQIENALRKLDEAEPYLADDVNRWKAAIYITDHVWEALGDVVVAARTAMDWLKEVAKVSVEADMPIRWTSPIGFPVMQDYRDARSSRVNVHIGGQLYQLFIDKRQDKFSTRRQTSGIAPNFVHALDASHLLSTVNLATGHGLSSFAVIHDSFAVHAADTTLLNAVLRESFVQQYSEPVLERFRDEIVDQLSKVSPDLVEKIPALPATGKLDLDSVRESDFFFA